MNKDEAPRLRQRMAITADASGSVKQDPMQRVHRHVDQRNIRHAVELIMASPDAAAIVAELRLRLRGRAEN